MQPSESAAPFIASHQQQAVIDWAVNGIGSLNLIARAGCGKTSTLMQLAATLVQLGLTGRGGAFIGAYNRAIANEIKARLAKRGITWKQVSAGTMHSAGFSAWKKVAPDAVANVDRNKCRKLWDARYLPQVPREPQVALYRDFALKAVSLAKGRALGCDSRDLNSNDEWFDIVEHFGLREELDGVSDVSFGVECAKAIYRDSLDSCHAAVDFDDLILAPLYFKARFWTYNWVMIDEAQDTNPARRLLALAMLNKGMGRLIAVGDPAQAIYGFTGADSNSMDLIADRLGSQYLPLNETYRCPKRIVALAQQWVPDITALPGAPEGYVHTISEKEFQFEPLAKTDAILCRKTAPLIDLAYTLLRRGVACKVEGRDIGSGLLKLASRFKVRTLDALMNRLDAYLAKETEKYVAKEQDDKAADLADRVETLKVIIEHMASAGLAVDDLKAHLMGMFQDSVDELGNPVPTETLTLCTVHRSKGREWKRVYLYGRNAYMPSRWAKKDWQLAQEDNLCYVAVTRAMEELIEVWVEEKRPK